MRTFILWTLVLGFASAALFGYRHLHAPRAASQPLAIIATRELRTNWRLGAEDLEYRRTDGSTEAVDSSVVGKYFIASGARASGAAVKLEEIADRPLVAARAGRFLTLVSIKDQPELASVLNADSVVALCADVCLESARVAFIWCATAEECLAAVSLDESQRSALKDLETFRIFLQGTF